MLTVIHRRTSPHRRRVTVVLALSSAGVTGPVLARSNYDGDWSVLITTQRGACEPAVRYGVQINNGLVSSPNSGPAAVQGRVSPRGDVRERPGLGNEWASGSGRLDITRGGGEWQGQGSSGVCYGTWLAERRSLRHRTVWRRRTALPQLLQILTIATDHHSHWMAVPPRGRL